MPPPLRCSSIFASASSCSKQICTTGQQVSRSFSSSPRLDRRTTRARRQLFRWLSKQGEAFRDPLPNSTNYLGAYNADGKLIRVVLAQKDAEKERNRTGLDETQDSENASTRADNKPLPKTTRRDQTPFPMNRDFVSQAVLSDELREAIWEHVMQEGMSVRDVSAKLGVEMSRVGAVVRLKEVEKEWIRIGKPLAKPYAEAVLSMVLKTKYDPTAGEKAVQVHESINDLPVHAATGQQIFHPTSESRHFTRVDAAKVFDENLLPADDRVPHPELTILHREREVERLSPREIQARAQAREEEAEKKRQRIAKRKAKEEEAVTKVDSGRWQFRFTDINVDDAGQDGRGYKGIGWRYGVPLMDRSRGQVKIPTSVK